MEREETAVAAASILARQRFVEKLAAPGTGLKMDLPRGATDVEAAARKIVAKHGAVALVDVAKLHFKTTARVIDDPADLRRVTAAE